LELSLGIQQNLSERHIMTLSIVGSGNIGSTLARHFTEKGVPVSIANNRGPSLLEPLCKKLGSHLKAVELAEALQAEMVILALPFSSVPQLADRTDWAGRIVIDATNAIDFPAFTPTDLNGKLSSKVVAELLSGARVVKAFNTLPAAVLGQNPKEAAGRRVIFLSGDDAEARAAVGVVIESIGFAPIDLGNLAAGRSQQFGEPLVMRNLLLQS
jgi:predicted dinucleotide-binding enzyme